MVDLVLEDLTVEFRAVDGYAVRPIDRLSVRVADGALTLLLGPSGSGKTTLLSVLGGILRPTSGSVRFGEVDLTELGEQALFEHRRDRVGFVFQAFNLIPSLTALDNVATPMMLTGTSRREARARARDLLARVGMDERAGHRPSELSGGQQQRVAIARGLVRDAPFLLADEPTANLDYVQAEDVIRLLRDLAEPGRIVMVASHDDRLLPVADESIDLTTSVEQAQAPALVELADGEVLFAQGSRGQLVYVVERGSIQITRDLVDGGHDVLAIRTVGEYFGELGPMMGQPRTASARALGDTAVRGMTLQAFRGARRDDAHTATG